MEWDNQEGVYKALTPEGHVIVVDGDELSEAIHQAEKDGSTVDLYDPAIWEELIGVNDNVRYASQDVR